ncbi:hypothetical protein HDU96_001071 [Phlyctochytrium bullatum]|nr:hypothetical protein HDU96_001071 [Phlyctochytrium bullatum]
MEEATSTPTTPSQPVNGKDRTNAAAHPALSPKPISTTSAFWICLIGALLLTTPPPEPTPNPSFTPPTPSSSIRRPLPCPRSTTFPRRLPGLLTLPAASAQSLGSTLRSTRDCTSADQLICKQDCGSTVIRCTGPGRGVEFQIQGSGFIKCFQRRFDGSVSPLGSFVISTVCSPSSVFGAVAGASSGSSSTGGSSSSSGSAGTSGTEAAPRLCGALENATTPEVELSIARTMNEIAQRRVLMKFADSVAAVFNVYFHVVYPSEGHVSKVSRQAIERQIDRMNQDFRTYKFNLARVTYYRNKDWFDKVNQNGAGQPFNNAMKNSTRIGKARDLNVWTVGFTNYGSLLGYATFPNEYAGRPWNDGVVIHHASLPGGSLRNYNLGRTLVHEVGHWLGLLHTFQGGCADGDGVADTPAERSGASGCPVGRDSCPANPGLDPIYNLMDYSYDSCMKEFTQGQYFRMAAAIENFRKGR